MIEVTPCVGVWIETMGIPLLKANVAKVTPCVGVWIETTNGSYPSGHTAVTPCVGVWIETAN